MIRSQGKSFSKEELNRIVTLLRDNNLSLTEIAERIRCSRSAVASINRKSHVRSTLENTINRVWFGGSND